MKRFGFILLMLLTAALWWPPEVSAQPAPAPGPASSQVTVTVSEKGARFRVDGLEYTAQALFNWPVGSKHLLEFVINNEDGLQYGNAGRTRYTFGGWADSKGGAPYGSAKAISVTSDPTITRYTASASVENLIQLVFFDAAPIPSPTGIGTLSATCGAPGDAPLGGLRIGLVSVNGACFWDNASFWSSGASLQLAAFPYPGFVFLGWKVEGVEVESAVRQTSITGNSVVYARFSAAKRVKFRTDPMGLKLRIDREEVRTTEFEPCEANNYLPIRPPVSIPLSCIGEFDFTPGSRHVLGAVSPQIDKSGRAWVFDSYSNGVALDSVYTADNNVTSIETIVGRYRRGVTVNVATQPAGLKVKIDGRDNWPENYFVFLPGSKHTVAAPTEVTDARGRKFVFRRWSNGGVAAHEFTVPENPDPTFQLVAEYDPLAQLSIRSNTPAGTISVDGAPCDLPCKVDRAAGSSVRVEVPELIPVDELQRLEFLGWSDGGPRVRTINLADTNLVELALHLRASYKVSAASDPGDGARFQFEPASPDGFYPGDSMVLVTVEAQPGFRFRRWDADLAGTSTIASLHMARPRSVIARLDKIPFIKPAGIRNAAGITPEGVVAPGSLIFIDGADLAPNLETGPSGPILAQALARTSVLVGSRILPLIFVSPERIQAQLPRDLVAGDYDLRVIRAGQEDITGKFSVVGSAPGLFSLPADGRELAQALHQDGTPVTADNPARRGETVTLLGTGFGAYKMGHPEGFALPASPDYPLTTPVEVVLGDSSKPADWAGGMAGRVGYDLVRVKIAEDAPQGGAQLKVRADGRESNAVILPVR